VTSHLSFTEISSTAETDITVINWEYKVFRGSLSKISVDVILQCKQFKRLEDKVILVRLHTQDILSVPYMVKRT
jgi:hypothetical protein